MHRLRWCVIPRSPHGALLLLVALPLVFPGKAFRISSSAMSAFALFATRSTC